MLLRRDSLARCASSYLYLPKSMTFDDGRVGLAGYFDEVEILLSSQLQCLGERLDPQLAPVRTDHSDLTGADPVVDPRLVGGGRSYDCSLLCNGHFFHGKRMRTPTKSRRPREAAARSLIDPDAPARWPGGSPPCEEAPLLLGCAADIVAQVSSLWTPGGEHRVPDDRGPRRRPTTSSTTSRARRRHRGRAARRAGRGPPPPGRRAGRPGRGQPRHGPVRAGRHPPVPASRPTWPRPPLAIDAMAAVVDAVGDRLGPNAGVLRDALAQIRLAFVQVRSARPRP